MSGPVLYRNAALADGRSATLQVGMSVLVEAGRIAWIRPHDDEPDPGPGTTVVDAGGTTIVPGMVDAHSHLTLPGGSHWIERVQDAPAALVEVAEDNALLLRQAGVRWARDVGSPRRVDPVDGRERALALGVRDRWSTRPSFPYVRAAGTWISRSDVLPTAVAIEVADADALLAAVHLQLDEGADLVKLYLDGPDEDVAPWTTDELTSVVSACHGRDARVAAHATRLAGAQLGAAAGVDSIEHGSEIDVATARTMVTNDVTLVSTLSVFASWQTFARTTTLPRFTERGSAAAIRERSERASESVMTAHRAGVRIAAGTDFGGGSTRANQLPWEVELLVVAGLEPWEALGAVTWAGGAVLGEEDAGRLREGGPADLVLVHGDPVSDPSALWRIWRVSW